MIICSLNTSHKRGLEALHGVTIAAALEAVMEIFMRHSKCSINVLAKPSYDDTEDDTIREDILYSLSIRCGS